MPVGIMVSLLVCAILDIALTAILTGIVNYKELNVAAPIALAIDQTGNQLYWLRPLIKVGAIAGLSSVVLVLIMGQSRIFYTMSKDGLLPAQFSKYTENIKRPMSQPFLPDCCRQPLPASSRCRFWANWFLLVLCWLSR